MNIIIIITAVSDCCVLGDEILDCQTVVSSAWPQLDFCACAVA